MSEYKKLVDTYNMKIHQASQDINVEFLSKVGELQVNCKHEKTHWIQEISEEGVLSSYLVKRCYICNSNIDKMSIDDNFAEVILKNYDELAEHYKETHPKACLPLPHSCWEHLDNGGYCKICGADMKQ